MNNNSHVIFMRIVVIFIVYILSPGFLFSQWYTDPAVNTAICDTVYDQNFVKMISDGKGGAYMVWTDHRDEPGVLDGDIYGQRINSSGYSLWTKNGISINSGTNAQVVPELISDGSGGFIVVWQLKTGLFYDRDIYAQRVDSLGNLLWNPGGIIVTNMPGTSDYQNVISDGNGGAIIAWQNLAGAGGDVDLFAQHLDQNGQALWATNGITICDTVELQSYPVQASDDNGGTMIAWSDSRNGFPNLDIYIQHFSGNGINSFTTNGIPLCNESAFQDEPIIMNIGSGYYIIIWEDYRNANGDLYMQKIDTTGTIYFPSNGVPVCLNASEQNNPAITGDGTGGFIICWTDLRNDAGDIFAQRFDQNGQALWNANGVQICAATDIQDISEIIIDNHGGAIISWMDYRDEWLGDIYAQRIDHNGNVLWQTNGVEICVAGGEQWGQQIISDDKGGSIIAWDDKRNGTDDNICIQNINYQGILGIRNQVSRRTNVNKAIIDLQTTSDTIDFNIQYEKLPSDIIHELVVFIDTVYHDGVGDLTFTLIHDGITDTLVHQAGGNSSNFIGTVLNDTSTMLISNGVAPFSGIYKPHNLLSVFNGMHASGNWILNVYDGATGNSGMLQAWGLSIAFQEYPAQIYSKKQNSPETYNLHQNYPNPFNPITHIEYEIPFATNVDISIYNILGKKVKTLVDTYKKAGSYSIDFNAAEFASGVYFYRIKTKDFYQSRKMIFMK